MSSLTEEQRKRIEENRRKALEKRKNSPHKLPPIPSVKSNDNRFYGIAASSSGQESTSSNYSTSTNGQSNVQRNQADIEANRRRAMEKLQAKKALPQNNDAVIDKIRPERCGQAQSKDLVHNYVQNVMKVPDQNANSVRDTQKSNTGAFKSQPRESSSHSAEQSKAANFFGQKRQLKGSCVLLDRYRFKVSSDYCAPLIDIFKTMKTRNYDAVSKDWSFKMEDYDPLMSKLLSISSSVQVTGLPKAVQNVFKRHFKGNYTDNKTPPADLSRIADQTMVDSLMPFQLEGVNFGVSRNGRLLLADDMGLGKSLQAICLAAYYRNDWPLLIVCPSSLRFAWKDQFLRWMTTVRGDEIQVCVTGKDRCDSLINIISYDLLARKADELLKQNFNCVILDESHLLKSGKTARTRAALPITKQSRRVILLSGTPALSRPNELYTQIQAVDPKLFTNFHDFGLRYCNGKKMPWGWDYSGSSNLEELQLLLEESIMIRRLKRDVIKQLPSKRREMVILDPQAISTRDSGFKNAEKNLGQKLKGAERHGALLQYFQETAKVKVNAVKNYVLDLLEAGKKFLLFAHHSVMMDAVQSAVDNKYDYIRIDGSVHPETRKILCDRFQRRDDVRIAILSITAANTGLNLTAASLVVFSELFWNPGVLTQAEDRVHRIGQESSVVIHYLVSTNTADDFIWPLIQGKLDVLGKAGLTKDNFSDASTVVARSKDRLQTGILDFFKEYENDVLTDDGKIVSGNPDSKIVSGNPDSKIVSGNHDSNNGSDVIDDWDDDGELESSMLEAVEAVESSSMSECSQNNLVSTKTDRNVTVVENKKKIVQIPCAQKSISSLWNLAGTSNAVEVSSNKMNIGKHRQKSRSPTNDDQKSESDTLTRVAAGTNDTDTSFDWLDSIEADFSEALSSPAGPDQKRRKLI